MGHDLPRPAAVIVGEPTDLQVADAHKSVVTYHHHRARPRGALVQAASRRQRGASAAALVGELDRIGEELSARGDPTGRFDPPYATVHVGTIRAARRATSSPKVCSLPLGGARRARHRRARGAGARGRLDAHAAELPTASRAPAAGIETVIEVDGAGPRAGAGLAGRDAGAAARPPQPHHRRALRHRGRPVPGGRPADAWSAAPARSTRRTSRTNT